MKLLIRNGRLVDPASGLDRIGDLAIAGDRIIALGDVSPEFAPDRTVDASGLVVAPGLVDLAARLREPGHEHEGMLESELAAAAAGGVTSLVCLPDTDPPLDEPGLVEMLKFRARRLSRCRQLAFEHAFVLVTGLAQPGGQVDQTGRDDEAAGVDSAIGRELRAHVAECDDPVARDRQVADAVEAAGGIDQAAASDQHLHSA